MSWATPHTLSPSTAFGRNTADGEGVPIKMVSELLGHSTTRMTLNVYSHVLHPMRQEAADRMDDLVEGAG